MKLEVGSWKLGISLTTNIKHLTSVIFILLLLLVLSIAGCNDKDKTPRKTLRMGYLQNDLHQLAAFVALNRGFFKEGGIQVKVGGVFRAGPEEMSAFSAGGLDFGYVGEAPATTAVANGTADVKILAQVNNEGSALVVKKDGNIHDLSGLAVSSQ